MILVTGATGHIGNVLVRHLLQQGDQVSALILSGEDETPLRDMPVKLVEGNVLDAGTLLTAMQNIDTVYHLAGLISIEPGQNPMVSLVNIVGTRNILTAARLSGVSQVVYTSSIHALSRVPHGVIINEEIPFDPVHANSEYDHSKAQSSLEVIKAVHNGLDAVIACPTGVIGPYDFRRSEIGQLILGCLKGKPQFYIDGAYDFVDVRDVALGLIQAAKFGRTGETYILSGEKISVKKLLDTIMEISGLKFPQIKIPISLAKWLARLTPLITQFIGYRSQLTPYAIETLLSNSDISHLKATKELNYQPRPLVDTLGDTITWLCETFIHSGNSVQNLSTVQYKK